VNPAERDAFQMADTGALVIGGDNPDRDTAAHQRTRQDQERCAGVVA
jgi:hypothetical protein